MAAAVAAACDDRDLCGCVCHRGTSPAGIATISSVASLNSIEILDMEIERCRSMLIPLLRKRNSLPPVSRLPPEVMAQIFHLCNPPSDPLRRIPVWRGSYHYSQVCHRWREIALGCPELWTCAPLSTSYMAHAMLARSAALALHVRARLPHSGGGDPTRAELLQTHGGLYAALKEVHRIKTLTIQTSFPRLDVFFVPALRDPAPLLEELRLDASEVRTYRTLPPMFDGHTPLLHTVELSGVSPDWKSPLLRNVTTLRISQTLQRGDDAWATLLSGLASLPQLEVVALKHALPRLGQASPHGAYITSRRLKSVFISDAHDRIAALLDCLRLRSTVELVGKAEDVTGHPVPRTILHRLMQSFATAMERNTQLQSLQLISSRDGNKLEMRTWTGTGRQRLQILHGLYRPLSESLFLLQSQNIEVLRVDALDGQILQRVWAELFAVVPVVQTIVVCGSDAKSFFQALQEDATRREGPSLPALRNVVVEVDTFDDWDLLRVLELRGTHFGVPLEELRFRGTASFDAAEVFIPGVERFVTVPDAWTCQNSLQINFPNGVLD